VGTTPGSIVVVPLANKDVKYTPESFMPIASLSEGGMMLVINASSPWKNLKELVEYSKKNPDMITFSSSGALGITHLLAEIFANEAAVKWRHIPYQGSGPAITALLGNHVTMATTAIAPASAHITAGTLRPLAIFGDKRLKAFPDVPTLKELGYSVGSPALYGISAPKGTLRRRKSTRSTATASPPTSHCWVQKPGCWGQTSTPLICKARKNCSGTVSKRSNKCCRTGAESPPQRLFGLFFLKGSDIFALFAHGP
jgi:tripartite-type tricarboxylate transporter receptor subunit TctC